MVQDEFRPSLRAVGGDVADDLEGADPVGEILADGGSHFLVRDGEHAGLRKAGRYGQAPVIWLLCFLCKWNILFIQQGTAL